MKALTQRSVIENLAFHFDPGTDEDNSITDQDYRVSFV